jgi:hypothetical protein
MKKLILSTALIAISLQAKLYAQDGEQPTYVKNLMRSKTEQTFNAQESWIGIRDFVVLKEGRMILELAQAQDYDDFRHLDSILQNFRRDIAFYKDSLNANPTGHVRIDYVLNPEYSFKKIRFKKYDADGNIFMNQDGNISRLKFDQDTIRIIIQKSMEGIGRGKNGPCTFPYSIQATFVLGNYYDIDKVVADHALKGIIDTLVQTTKAKNQKKINRPPYYYFVHPLSIVYNPYYSGEGSLRTYDRLMKNEYDIMLNHLGNHLKEQYLSINPYIGMGLVRNTIAPMAEIGLQYNKRVGGSQNYRDFFRVSAAPYFFFDKDAEGNYKTNDNWFINADIGSTYDGNEKGWLGKTVSFGAGYLVVQNGGYFKNTTFKIFTDMQVVQRFTIVPEIIFTNNFKQIFPGFTLKVF